MQPILVLFVTCAAQTLTEIQNVLESKKKNKDALLVELCNKFFTIIPHSFSHGEHKTMLIDSHDKLEAKVQMLDALTDIEIASKLIKAANLESSEHKVHPLDSMLRFPIWWTC